MPKQNIWKDLTNEEILHGIDKFGSEDAYARTFNVTARWLRVELCRRGLVIKKGRKRPKITPIESEFRGRFPRWYAKEGRYKAGLSSYKAFAAASGLGTTEIRRFFQRRKELYIKFLREHTDPREKDFVFTSVCGKKFPGKAIAYIPRYHLDAMSVQLTVSMVLKNEQAVKVRMALRPYLENVFGITVPYLVDQVKEESPGD